MKEFDKVVGYESIKYELYKIIDMMLHSAKYVKLGANIPKGLMLTGDPGVGKTLLATCFMKASKRNSYTIRKVKNGNDFIEEIEETFTKAKENSPSIILLDDLDKFSSSNDDRSDADEFAAIQSVIDEYLEDDIFIVATVNNYRKLPDSLKRHGRFDYHIDVRTPKIKELTKIVEHYLKSKRCSDDIKPEDFAKLFLGKSAADIKMIINDAAIISGFDNHKFINKNDLIRAYMKETYDSLEDLNPEENLYKKETAYHEAGHAVVAEILEPGSVNFITTKPNLSSTEAFTCINQSNNYFSDLEYMKNRVMVLLAGKAAVDIVFGKVDVGAGKDLERAYKIVKRFETIYCASSFDALAFGDCSAKPYEYTDIAISKELSNLYAKTKKILIEGRMFLDKLADKLYSEQILFDNDVLEIKKLFFKNS